MRSAATFPAARAAMRLSFGRDRPPGRMPGRGDLAARRAEGAPLNKQREVKPISLGPAFIISRWLPMGARFCQKTATASAADSA